MPLADMQHQDIWTEQEIKSLLIRERYYRDTFQWDKLRNSYAPDAGDTSINISWISGDVDAFVEGSKHMAASGTHSAHTFQPVEIHFDKSGFKALAFSTASVMVRFMFEDVEYDMVSWVRLVSRVQKFDEAVGWRMLTLEAIYDRDSVAPTKPGGGGPQPVIDTTGSRASYKYLTWALTLRGYKVSQDLPGTDDEKSMKKCLDESYSWLNGGA